MTHWLMAPDASARGFFVAGDPSDSPHGINEQSGVFASRSVRLNSDLPRRQPVKISAIPPQEIPIARIIVSSWWNWALSRFG